MNEQQKVLIVENSGDVTGALNAILNTIKDLEDDFEFVFVISSKSKVGSVLEERGLKFYRIPFLEINKSVKSVLLYLPFLIANGFRLRKIIALENVSIVHVNDFYNLTPAVAKLIGQKFSLIAHVRFVLDRFPPSLVWIWEKANTWAGASFVCVSKVVASHFKRSSKVFQVYDTLPKCEKYPFKEVMEGKWKTRLLYIANYIPGKGQDLAIEAFKIAFKKNKNLTLKFVGGDMGLNKNLEYKFSLHKMISTAGLVEVIELASFSPDVEEEIKSADICLNFSESESFSLTCLDALYYGTPLIATDCGGPRELFENGKSGFLVENRNIHQMAEAIIKLSENINLQKLFSENGRRYVENKFSKNNTSFKIRDIYREENL